MVEVVLSRDSEVASGRDRQKGKDARESPAAGKHRAKAGASHLLFPLGDGQKSLFLRSLECV